MSESSALIERLRLVASTAGGSAPLDTRLVEAWREEGLARGKLHEVFVAEPDDTGAGAGFALALALAARALPVLWLRTEDAERRAGRLSAGGAAELGLDPAALLLGLVGDEAALLRAAADAARCAGLGTVLVEAWGRAPGLDLTATRRLMLAAEGSGVTVLVLRADASPTPSAARRAGRSRRRPRPRSTPTHLGGPPSISNVCAGAAAPRGSAGAWSGTVRPKLSSMPRRYLALVFPWLSIERLRSTRPHLFVGRDESPIAFVETSGNATRLVALDRAAVLAGLTPGLTLADARARVPELDVFDHDAHADHQWLERLAEGCQRYTPMVMLRPHDALVLDIAGCTHEFEGERFLAADVEGRLARRGVLARHAFGDTAAIAEALARFAGAPAPDEKRAVRRLPVAALGLDDEATTALARAGLKTVGDVMARPLAGLAARFGEGAARAVRRLAGDESVPLAPVRRLAPIAVERRFAEPIARADQALAVIAELVGEAAALLETRHQGGRRWRVRLFRTDGDVRGLTVETGRPTRDVGVLTRLLRERIDGLADPLDPGFGYDLIRLDVALAEGLDASQLKLEGGAGPEGQVAELVARLSTRLGRERVRRFAPRDSHIPEQAELTLPAIAPPISAGAASPAWPAAEPGEPPLRPIYLFDPPQRIDEVMAEVPDGPPRRFRWRRTLHEVARAEGPERIAGEWWRRHDRTAPTRDYYRIEDRRGRRFWIFRHGLFGESDDPRWYLHGLFA